MSAEIALRVAGTRRSTALSAFSTAAVTRPSSWAASDLAGRRFEPEECDDDGDHRDRAHDKAEGVDRFEHAFGRGGGHGLGAVGVEKVGAAGRAAVRRSEGLARLLERDAGARQLLGARGEDQIDARARPAEIKRRRWPS